MAKNLVQQMKKRGKGETRGLVPQVKSQKAYRAEFLAIWNGWFISAELY
jgi:hypothetical protein